MKGLHWHMKQWDEVLLFENGSIVVKVYHHGRIMPRSHQVQDRDYCASSPSQRAEYHRPTSIAEQGAQIRHPARLNGSCRAADHMTTADSPFSCKKM